MGSPWILALVPAAALALYAIVPAARNGWRAMRAARDPRCPHCGILPCPYCWSERL